MAREHAERRYDVILYGASGFTGHQTARYFARRASDGLRWAIAGRNRQKLDAVAAECGGPDVVVADSGDPPSVEAMVAQTRVLLTTAGPFARYGEPVIAACARQGADYVDITGETPWVRRMIDGYQAAALESGAKIVPFCGFDSVPSDLGAWLMVDHLRREWGQGCRRVKAYFRVGGGGLNGGTLASALGILEEDPAALDSDPLLLNPPGPRPASAAADLKAARKDEDLQAWIAPFFMGPINSRVVRRSAALSASYGEPYGADFDYQEAMGPLPVRAALGVAAGLRLAALGGRLAFARRLAEKWGPAPGEGPSEEAMARGWMRCRLLAEAEDGRRAWGEFAAQGDPGNRITVAILCEAALALARQREELPGGAARAGFLTPATAMGPILADRLRAAGMTLLVHDPA